MRAQSLTNPPMFSNAALKSLILPLVFEQLLIVTVGMADTVMVSSCGEAAVSGISLVDQMNILLIQIFAALATGGAVVVSQYLGRREKDNAGRAAKQLLYLTVIIAGVIAALVVVFNRSILRLVFGHVDADVMSSAETYFWLSALSYPFLGLYNAGAALFRSMGNSRISLLASAIMNVINIGGNAILIYGFQMGVAGAAIASLVSRAVAGIIMVALLRSDHNPVQLTDITRPQFSGDMIRSILRVGVPNGLENGVFQIGKLLVSSLIASFGTTAIAANAICNNVASISNVPGSAVGLSMITVVGRTVGARDYQQARYYTRKLLTIAYIGMGVINVLLFFASPWLVNFYQMSQETTSLACFVLQFNCVCTAIFWPMSFTMPNALRATGDARYTMVISMISMWLCRILMSYVLGGAFGLGLVGVWTAMILDWIVRGIFFFVRFKGGKWEKAKVIDN